MQTWLAEEDDTRSGQLLKTVDEAWCAWLTTPPTTMAGTIATLTYAEQHAYPDADYANLAEATQLRRRYPDSR
jgi:hypothetical protein